MLMLISIYSIPKQLRGYYDPHEPGFPPGYIEMLWNDPQPEEGLFRLQSDIVSASAGPLFPCTLLSLNNRIQTK
jgi:hypothetical protein